MIPMKRTMDWILALACWAGLYALPAHSVTLHVPAEYATINDGLRASASGDTVLVAPGIYTDSDNVDGPLSCARLVGGVKLVSEGGPGVTTIDMQGAYEFGANAIKAFSSDEPMWIEGFTITGSPQGRAGIAAGSIPKLTVKDCIVRDLDSGYVGGGGISAGLMDLDVIDCHFLRCYGDYGAGIGLKQCATRVIGCTFEDCDRNAICHLTGDIFTYDESLVIEDCEFFGNHAYIGGAIAEGVDGDVVISGCWFEGNSADQRGGAVYLAGGAATRIVEDCVFRNNHALGGSGGGLKIYVSTEITGCTFFGNSAGSSGAALRVNSGDVSLENSIVANSLNRPAVALYDGSLVSACNVFWNNESGNAYNWTPGPTDFEADPRFCDPESGNFTLSSDSPCLPENNPFGCDLIGAFGEGCGGVSVESSSWGRIKQAYRTRTGERP